MEEDDVEILTTSMPEFSTRKTVVFTSLTFLTNFTKYKSKSDDELSPNSSWDDDL